MGSDAVTVMGYGGGLAITKPVSISRQLQRQATKLLQVAGAWCLVPGAWLVARCKLLLHQHKTLNYECNWRGTSSGKNRYPLEVLLDRRSCCLLPAGCSNQPLSVHSWSWTSAKSAENEFLWHNNQTTEQEVEAPQQWWRSDLSVCVCSTAFQLFSFPRFWTWSWSGLGLGLGGNWKSC